MESSEERALLVERPLLLALLRQCLPLEFMV